MTRKRICRVLLAMLLVAALTTPALAGQGGHGKAKGNPFKDLEGNWAQWHIMKMVGAKIMAGLGNGSFDPGGLMNRAQVAVMFCRALGLEEQAEGDGPPWQATFGDEHDCPVWAKNHIRVCFMHRLMLGEMRGNGKFFNPMKPITRIEFVVLLVRSAGLDDEAAAYVDTPAELAAVRSEIAALFRDHKSIGDWALGYLKVALEEGWISGYLDGTFQPNKPVTRAEACKLLDGAEDWIGPNWKSRHTGVIAALGDDTITIRPEDADPGDDDETYDVAEDCVVKIDGEPAEFEDLELGWEVKLYVNDDGVVCIQADSGEEDDDDDEILELEGVITAVRVDEDEITFDPAEAEDEDPDDETTDYEVSADVVVKDAEGHTLDWDDEVEEALEGETVEIKLVGGIVVRIKVLHVEEEFEGLITAVNLTGRKVTFDPDEADGEDPDDDTTVYTVAGDAVIKDAEGDNIPWDDDVDEALEGEQVEIKLIDGVVVRIEVIED